MKNEPSRQIHLDFHTSEHLPEIGGEFDKVQFQSALQVGRVNLINVFAKCHHSWSYYPTKIGKPHPNLRVDLLGGQIEACHEIGIAAPIYYTVGWSAHDAESHPQWCMRNADGSIVKFGWPDDVTPDTPKPAFQWKSLCVSGEYHELIRAQTDEICGLYPVDGFWYDIYHPHQVCYCDNCMRGMRDGGFDTKNPADVERYRARTVKGHQEDLVQIIHEKHPEASIYFNGLTSLERPQNFRYRFFEYNTKNDLEDLPTTWGGYDKFPLRAKIFHREEKPIVAMSGKFHTAWGEFGGFKAPEALRFEAASMIAFGARCNFGDQLHPSGLMDPSTYANIGHAYEYVEKIEEYGIDGRPAASLGIIPSYQLAADEGLCRMLMEEQYDFDVVTKGEDLSRFEVVAVPSHPGIMDPYAEEIEKYLASGGKVICLGQGILKQDATAPVLECGAAYTGAGEYDIDYTDVGIEAAAAISNELPASPFLNYSPALRFHLDSSNEDAAGITVLANIHEPYFSRTYGAYCGHQNTPYQPEPAAHPAIFRHGNLIVAAHPLDRIYYAHGAKVHRTLFVNVLRLLHASPMVEAGLPSAGRVSLLHQPKLNRYVVHLLYAPPLERGRCVVIEDIPVLRDIAVRLRLPEKVKSVTIIPEGREADYTQDGGETIELTVPAIEGHCAIVARY